MRDRHTQRPSTTVFSGVWSTVSCRGTSGCTTTSSLSLQSKTPSFSSQSSRYEGDLRDPLLGRGRERAKISEDGVETPRTGERDRSSRRRVGGGRRETKERCSGRGDISFEGEDGRYSWEVYRNSPGTL